MLEKGGFSTREEVLSWLTTYFKKDVLVLPGEDEHQDRYHTPLGVIQGKRTNLLADPVAVFEIFAAMRPDERTRAVDTMMGAYFSENEIVRRSLTALFSGNKSMVQRLQKSSYVHSLEQTERMLVEKGIRVVRIPTLHRTIFK